MIMCLYRVVKSKLIVSAPVGLSTIPSIVKSPPAPMQDLRQWLIKHPGFQMQFDAVICSAIASEFPKIELLQAGAEHDWPYRTRNGKLWLDSYVTRILEDTSAKGVYTHNRTKNVGNWKREPKPESEWGIVQVQPIVSESVWDEVNPIVEEQRKAMVRPGKRPKHIFAGKLRCKCGKSMYVLSATPENFCEKCRTRVPIVDLEAIFLDQLKAFFADPQRIAGHIRKANETVSEKSRLLESAATEIDKVKDQMTRTHQLYLDQSIDSQGFKELYAPMKERLEQLQEDCLRVQADLEVCKVNGLSVEAVVSEAFDLQKRWPMLETEEKRRIVESIVERIVVDNDAKEIELTLSCIPTSEETTNSQQLL